MKFRCPVCMFPDLPYAPADYHICPCCSTEFGNDDAHFSHFQLREMWIGGGAQWFFGNPPAHWNAWMQLINAGLEMYVPKFYTDLQTQSRTVGQPTEIRYRTEDPELCAVA
jgi:hypothetical protein